MFTACDDNSLTGDCAISKRLDINPNLTGMYDQGFTPSGQLLLFSNSTSGSDVLIAMSVHQGRPSYSDDDSADADCGDAVPFDGIILDGFMVPSYLISQG